MKLTSAANPLLKQIRRASRRGGLTDDGCALAESPHLLREALEAKVEIEAVVAAEGAELPDVERVANLYMVPDELFRDLASTDNSQGVISLVRLPNYDLGHLLAGARRVVLLDGVQDPGNAGAIVRSAEAFGADVVLFCPGSASPSNPKTLRASAGSLFRLPFVKVGNTAETIEALGNVGLPLVAAVAHGGTPIDQADLGRAAIVIGSEAHGVSADYLEASRAVQIPVKGVESLNAAAAAAVLLYEADRQTRG